MAKKVTLRLDLKSWGKLATVSIHKQTYKIVIDGMVEDFKQITFYLPRSITQIPVFDSDERENQFVTFLDIEIDKWFVEKEKYVDDYEHIIIAAE